jgi:hypothetical protein
VLVDVWVDVLDGVERGLVSRPGLNGGGPSGTVNNYLLGLDATGKMFVEAGGIQTETVRATETVPITGGSWQRYIAVWDQANLNLYRNGALVATVRCTYVPGTTGFRTYVGRVTDDYALTWGHWLGKVGALVMLRYAATAQDVACNPLFAQPYGLAAPPPPGP